jgi:hypothetical protein
MGPVVAAVTAIAAIIATLSALNWSAVSAGFDAIADAVKKFIAFLEALPARFSVHSQTDADFPTGVQIDAAYAKQNGIGGFRQDPEASHGRALMALPPPVVNNNIKVGVNVTLDGRQIASLVQTQIMRENRSINNASGFDGSARAAYPDMGTG